MPRIRTIKPEYWDDEKIALLSRDARLVYIAMWNFSDDYGVVKGVSIWLKSKIFPYDTIQTKQFDGWLLELQTHGFIVLFQAKAENYYHLPNFCRHQVINKPSQMRNPAYLVKKEEIKDVTKPAETPKDYGSTTVVATAGVGVGREREVVGDESRKCAYYIGSKGFDLLYDYISSRFPKVLESLQRDYPDPLYSKALEEFSKRNLEKEWKDEADFKNHLYDSFKKFKELNGVKILAEANMKNVVRQDVNDLLKPMSLNGKHS